MHPTKHWHRVLSWSCHYIFLDKLLSASLIVFTWSLSNLFELSHNHNLLRHIMLPFDLHDCQVVVSVYNLHRCIRIWIYTLLSLTTSMLIFMNVNLQKPHIDVCSWRVFVKRHYQDRKTYLPTTISDKKRSPNAVALIFHGKMPVPSALWREW